MSREELLAAREKWQSHAARARLGASHHDPFMRAQWQHALGVAQRAIAAIERSLSHVG